MSTNEIQASVLLVGNNLSGCLSPWFFHLEHQDYPLAQFEWIIVDMNPTEETRNIFSSLSKGSPLIARYIQHGNDSVIKAWDVGFHEARGKWILCSQPEVLPSNNWVQRHVQLQYAYEGNACIGGALLPHPRLPSKSLTPWLLPEDEPPSTEQVTQVTPLHFSIYNMSIPKDLILRGGSFNKSFYFVEFAEVELVRRLSRAGCKLHIDNQALCWLWKGNSYIDMCRYHYRRGYSMGCYLRLFPNDYQIVVNYKLYFPYPTRIINALLIPYYHRLCLKLPEDSKLLQRMYRRILRYWRYRGFTDAMAKQEPQIDIIYS